MRAVGLDFESRSLVERQVAEPPEPREGEVLVRVREVGVCGTDRELAQFHFGAPPENEAFLTIGHEAIGQVAACGLGVETLQVGDWVAPTVRRPCQPPCEQCARGRRDLCARGRYRERGIVGLHGYYRDYVVDLAEDLVRVPDGLVDRGVLLEPMSVVEKATTLALRYHESGARTAAVLGAGPIGILAGLVLQLRGLDVAIHSLEPPDHPRARIVSSAGMAYGRPGQADIVIEATGSRQAILRGFDLMGPNAVYIILGAADPEGKFPATRMILENQTVAGSVNSSPEAWRKAVEDLGRLDSAIVSRLIERHRFDEWRETLLGPPPDRPKVVHVIDEQ